MCITGVIEIVFYYLWYIYAVITIIQIKNNEQANRMEIYEKTLQVLGPEVEKAKKMMLFVNEAAARFTEEIKTLAHPEKRKDFISETYLLTIAKLINMFSTLDALKNMKACINNDMACYKRSVRIGLLKIQSICV